MPFVDFDNCDMELASCRADPCAYDSVFRVTEDELPVEGEEGMEEVGDDEMEGEQGGSSSGNPDVGMLMRMSRPDADGPCDSHFSQTTATVTA